MKRERRMVRDNERERERERSKLIGRHRSNAKRERERTVLRHGEERDKPDRIER